APVRAHSPRREDRPLAWIHQRKGHQGPAAADVGDRDAGPCHVTWLQAALARPAGEAGDRLRDGLHVEAPGVPNDRHHQTLRHVGAGGGAGPVPAGAGSPASAIRASTSPTGTVSPSATRTAASTPSAGASSSEVTLSVSISTSGSPRRTASPAVFSQRATVPST